MIYFYLSTAVFIGGLFIVYWLHSQFHLDIVVTPVKPPTDAPLISVCVPARNEERNIGRCVESLLGQDYPNFEVIVLDDRSTDRTPEILRNLLIESDGLPSTLKQQAASLQIIPGADLPSGWAGKPYALFQAASAAHGLPEAWLCFVDADTFLSSNALSACYAKAIETRADMFTIMTFQILGSFWEKVVMPIVMTALSVGFSPRKVNDPNRKDAIANGQFILIKHSVYDAIGGHEIVRDKIAEDKAIAEQVKWNGYRLVVADGNSVARTRMYTSLPEMWEGWTKNIFLGLRDRPSLMILGIFLSLVAAFILPILPVLGGLWYLEGGGWPALTVIVKSLILGTIVIYARARVAAGMGISPWYALTLPLGAAMFAAMMFTSTWKVLSGRGVSWKGRMYAPK